MSWSFLRVLLPSWRFFDDVGLALTLELQRAQQGEQHWTRMWLPPPRPWHALLCNPRGNLALYRHSLMERLLDEREPGDSAPYRQLCRMLEAELPSGARYRFRIKDGHELVLVSALHQVP